MPRSFSRSQIDKLGRRLAAGGPVAPDDEAMLAQLLLDYRTAMAAVRAVVTQLGLELSSRLKTVDTLTDKLRRGTRLSSVQDIAGVRVVVGRSRREQDLAVDRLVAAFTGDGHEVRVHDRRQAPSSGYRAVHVVVTFDGCPVEVQVRTHSQHVWANAMERLADRVGRGVRYGGQPDDAADATSVAAMLQLAEELDTAERADAPPDVLRAVESRITSAAGTDAGTVTP